MPNGVDGRIARRNRSSRFGCALVKEREKLKIKRTNPYNFVEYVHLRPGKFSRSQISLDYSGWWQNKSCS